jgi:hypothetical protein
MAMSHNGVFLSQPGGPLPRDINSYSMPLYRASDLSVFGVVPPPDVGFPEAVAFSADDRAIFAAFEAPQSLIIERHDTHTFAFQGSFSVPNNVTQWLIGTDQSGRNLFVSYTGLKTQIFDTGMLAGDFNDDHVVDSRDYVVWRKNPGNIYTQDDYSIWRAHFGQTAGSGSGASANAAVPEPATLALIILAAAGYWGRRRRSA